MTKDRIAKTFNSICLNQIMSTIVIGSLARHYYWHNFASGRWPDVCLCVCVCVSLQPVLNVWIVSPTVLPILSAFPVCLYVFLKKQLSNRQTRYPTCPVCCVTILRTDSHYVWSYLVASRPDQRHLLVVVGGWICLKENFFSLISLIFLFSSSIRRQTKAWIGLLN